MLRLVNMACAGVLILAAGALAHDSDADAHDAHLARAREIVELMDAERLYRQLIDSMMPAVRPSIRQGWPHASRESVQEVVELMEAALLAAAPEYLDDTAAFYARNFTPEELAELAAFLRTPTGARFIEKQDHLRDHSRVIGHRISGRIALEMMPQFSEMLERG